MIKDTRPSRGYDADVALPDYPGLKQDISNYLLLVLQAVRQQRMGPFNKSAHVTYHEGDSNDFSTVDGEVKELDLQEAGVEETLSYSDLGRLTHAQIVEIMAKHGVQFADQTTQRFLSNLNETLDAAGQVVNTEGRALDADLLLEIYQGIELSFDDAGQVNLPDVIPTNPMAHAALAQIHENPEFVSRLNILIEQKREEWLARESNRKLVD